MSLIILWLFLSSILALSAVALSGGDGDGFSIVKPGGREVQAL